MKDRNGLRLARGQRVSISPSAVKQYDLPSAGGIVVDTMANPYQLVSIKVDGYSEDCDIDLHAKSLTIEQEST